MKQNLNHILWPALAGILAALLVLDRWMPGNSSQFEAQGPASYAEAVHKATPSVVNIYTAKLVTSQRNPLLEDRYFRRFTQNPARRQRIERALGSGVIMTQEGHILTNNHVIAGADAIQVMLHDGRSSNAVVISTDPATDLAVLKTDLPNLTPFELADSDLARVGDVVLAIGNPLGFGHSVTQGIVSALGRYGLQLHTYEDYIQTDASIHQGNSGGALVDTRGQLLGINTLIYTTGDQNHSASTGIGISLAIPSNLAVFVMRDLINYGKVVRGWLGLSVDPVKLNSPQGRIRQALLVAAVASGSPADKAGVQVGDLITHIDGEAVLDGRLTMHRIAMLRPGEKVSIAVLRNSENIELHAMIGAQQQPAAGQP